LNKLPEIKGLMDSLQNQIFYFIQTKKTGTGVYKSLKINILIIIFFFILIFIASGCFNPFAPKLDTTTNNENILSDQKTVEGLFQNFKYAYIFKDTTIYGQLLTDDFIFTYFDYELSVEVSWDRPTDMKTTNGLFLNTQDLNLVWNNIVYQDGDSLYTNVKRSFNLTITFNPNDIINFYGFVDMALSRATINDKWRIKKWKDLTNS